MLHLHALLYQREFLSTPSARRATSPSWRCCMMSAISIHALREEGDLRILLNSALISLFLSTPSARRATPECGQSGHKQHDFYPRPPRGGRPRLLLPCIRKPGNFYPRPPRGGRQTECHSDLKRILFLSTPSARRATACFPPRPRKQGEFLSTPSARRATSIPRKAFEEFVFLSTPSARRATYPKKTGKQYALFLSTPSARRATGILLSDALDY